ncbi:hypothetical protein GOP47_0016260 [Adiantum capillus-veneris]|uniref:Uncharacterized protein n=1 Tax=Adiantum capillus-veneris TaxID=13818 RepID=A0A9D4ZBW3_ADICA|nr:hypothetical protein GOP47_0016260 [Adiantum capillus-veneris]
MEQSRAFMEAVLALFFSEDALVLEMGCGTSPVLKACQATWRACFSFDSNAGVVNLVVRTLVEAMRTATKGFSWRGKGSMRMMK